jgi:hypothetical protein
MPGFSAKTSFYENRIPLFPALGIGIGAIMRDGGWKSEAMVARYTEHLQVKQGASAILAARQARL